MFPKNGARMERNKKSLLMESCDLGYSATSRESCGFYEVLRFNIMNLREGFNRKRKNREGRSAMPLLSISKGLLWSLDFLENLFPSYIRTPSSIRFFYLIKFFRATNYQ